MYKYTESDSNHNHMMWDGIPSAQGTDILNTEVRTEFIILLNARVVPLQGAKTFPTRGYMTSFQ